MPSTGRYYNLHSLPDLLQTSGEGGVMSRPDPPALFDRDTPLLPGRRECASSGQARNSNPAETYPR